MQPRSVAIAIVGLVVVASVPFGITPSGPTQPPVSFDATKPTGIADRVALQARNSTLVLPKAQVYYSEYRYVVGYYGITSLVAGLQTNQQREPGRPLTIYVSDFSGTAVRVDGEGVLRMPRADSTGWIPARTAYFVVNSSASVPSRETAIVPFSSRSDATVFSNRYGGRILRWDSVSTLSIGPPMRTIAEWQRVVQRRQSSTDRAVAEARSLLDRPVSVTVGREAATLADAIERAPPNTTVRVPPGNYTVGSLRVSKPLTIRGAGPNATHVVGNGSGNVIVTTAPETAIAGLSIRGVGSDRSGNGDRVANVSVPRDSWKYRYYKVHGYGDAAIVFDSAGSSLVSRVRVRTPSNWIIARSSPGVVVSNLTLYGTKQWEDGFLGVSAIGAGVIVQDSTLYGGKAGVYAYDAPGVVVRGSTMEGMMIGVFDLFSPKLLVANSSFEDLSRGINAETRSHDSAIVNNEIHNTYNGLIVEGQHNFVGQNVFVHNRNGMQVYGQYAIYWGNILAFNQVGATSNALIPLERVRQNDFVGNRRQVTTQSWNFLHVWPNNYWHGAPGVDDDRDGYLERSFRPTGTVDRRVGTVDGAPTLAHSPAHRLVRTVGRVVPGLRGAGVLDRRPRARPIHPDRIATMLDRYDRAGRHEDADPWDYKT